MGLPLGRKPKYTPELRDEICGWIEKGLTDKDAILLANIGHDTFYRWINKYQDFSEALKKAEAKFKQRHIALISVAAEKSWQAAAWLMERKYKDEWGAKPTTIIAQNFQATPVNPHKLAEDLKIIEATQEGGQVESK